jgi:hypothetical protein
MVICPIANSIGCDKCAVVDFCFLRSVLGNYGAEQPGQEAEDSKSTESKPPD